MNVAVIPPKEEDRDKEESSKKDYRIADTSASYQSCSRGSLNCISIAKCRHTSLAGMVMERSHLIGQFVIARGVDRCLAFEKAARYCQ